VIRDATEQAQTATFGSDGAGVNASYLWLGGAVPVSAPRPLNTSLQARAQLVWTDGRCAPSPTSPSAREREREREREDLVGSLTRLTFH
jgi:hypothetical protein